ncbi:hypothetical protein SEA_COLT_34 [Mycobacterium phage Colt]|uniref:Uncharacterized protein n=1 Tax=Mycobacterium phage Cane17 TaxID=2301548 RepID=A0A346N8L1_9CAUD|nr:hypothetical protein KHO59_gp032 [Mycobacterium phage Cane17]AXQ51646.1 hypothetical protein SEA_CANE17_32 [Mycobacterium phage Cane17]QAY13982.1 hypothetical protein SEA_COLT_34 [Mycobacterium phage Colt]
MRWPWQKRPLTPEQLEEDRRVAVIRERCPHVSRATALRWYEEDVAFGRFAAAVLDAASRGVDTSFLHSCPDLHALALMHAKGL